MIILTTTMNEWMDEWINEWIDTVLTAAVSLRPMVKLDAIIL